ncbi:MAG TPA: hypothetical protein VL461_03045 [Dictyobacter sp.]|nr:hypothetical protein [Dictyobacter sp.]
MSIADTTTGKSNPPPTPQMIQQPGAALAIQGTGTFHEFPLPQQQNGLMRPVIDAQGRIWFGEMGRNALASFDPHTRQFTQITIPHGQGGIMGVLIAPDNSVWFSEQTANYIGHYMPTTGTFQTYPLPVVHIPDPSNPGKQLTLPSAPNDLAWDQHGNIWFTEMNVDTIGKLNTSTGQFTYYPLTKQRSIQKLNPYGITVDAQGKVWFTESGTNNLGYLDPVTGQIRTYTQPTPDNPLMEIVSDKQGTIWATSFNHAILVKFIPHTYQFTAYQAPAAGANSGMYGITITPDNAIWVTLMGNNTVARFDAIKQQFVYYAIPTSGSAPIGIATGIDHTLWFTETRTDQLGSLVP